MQIGRTPHTGVAENCVVALLDKPNLATTRNLLSSTLPLSQKVKQNGRDWGCPFVDGASHPVGIVRGSLIEGKSVVIDYICLLHPPPVPFTICTLRLIIFASFREPEVQGCRGYHVTEEDAAELALKKPNVAAELAVKAPDKLPPDIDHNRLLGKSTDFFNAEVYSFNGPSALCGDTFLRKRITLSIVRACPLSVQFDIPLSEWT